MKKLCITAPVAEMMKRAFRSGELSIQELYQASSEQRREMFANYATEDLAQEINARFEEAMISKQQDALKEWATAVFTPEEKQGASYKTVIEKIEDLKKLGVFDATNSDSFLEDLAADKLGVNVTLEEAREINQRAERLQELFQDVDEIGDPKIGYWIARKEMDEYLASLAPTSNLRVVTSTIRRSSMLFSLKSPTVNIISNLTNGIFTAFERRLGENKYAGLNPEYALQYARKVWDIYQASGYDISRMKELYAGVKVRGEDVTHSEGPGAIRSIGRFYEDVVFKQLMGAPDVVFSAAAFADSANLLSTAQARAEGLSGDAAKARALDLFKMATSVQATDETATLIRNQAIAEAQLATWTNDGEFSNVALAIRNLLNNATGDVRLGDQVMPFVKTPANVVEYNVDVAGGALLKVAYKLPSAIRAMQRGDMSQMFQLRRYAIRAGLGFTFTLMLAYAFDPDDFVGEYENQVGSGRALVNAKNAGYNSIRIGEKWISLDYFGPLAATFVGIMYARKYGNDLPSVIGRYLQGAGGQTLKTPGLRQIADTVTSVSDFFKYGDIADIQKALASSTVDYFRTIIIPAAVSDLARATDEFERKTEGDPVAKVAAAVPGLRQTLPIKTNPVTGEAVQTEGFVSTLLFGNRLKTANNDPVVTEINRLYYQGALPTISSVEYASKRMKELKRQIGDGRFNEAVAFFGQKYSGSVAKLIRRGSYKRADVDDQKKMINDERTEAVEKTLRKFKYKKPRKNSSAGGK